MLLTSITLNLVYGETAAVEKRMKRAFPLKALHSVDIKIMMV